MSHSSFDFTTTIGKGYTWTDNGFIRVVVEDEYGQKTFRFSLDQIKSFIAAVEACALVAAVKDQT